MVYRLSGWMYRLGLEAILGLRREGSNLLIAPKLPSHWQGFTATYRYGRTCYNIQVRAGLAQPGGPSGAAPSLYVDGVEISGNLVPLQDDGRETLSKSLPM